MEFSLREWLIVIGVLIIIVILIDGYRRYKKNNAFEDAEEDDFVDPDVLLKDAIIKRELPNGGARPVAGSEAVNSAFEVARKTSNAPLTDLPHKLDSGPLFQKDDHIHLDELASLVPERLSSTDESELRRNYSDDSEQFDVDETLAEEDFERNYSIVDVDQPVSGSSTEEFLEEDYEAEIEEVSEASVLSSIAKNVSAAYEQAFFYCSWFGEFVEQENITISLNDEFQVMGLNAQERQEVVAAWQNGIITWTEARAVYRRKGIATEADEDAKTEIQNELISLGDEPEPTE